MRDSSIRGEKKSGNRYIHTDDQAYRCEFVTPVLTYEDIPHLQGAIRAIRNAGGKVNSTCGIHIHVDAANHNRQSLKNLISIMYSKEDMLFKALQVNENRAQQWCQKVQEPMLKKARRLSSEATKDLTQLERIWYEGNVSPSEHYHWTRYYAIKQMSGSGIVRDRVRACLNKSKYPICVDDLASALMWIGAFDSSHRKAPATHAGHCEDHRTRRTYLGSFCRSRYNCSGCCAGRL